MNTMDGCTSIEGLSERVSMHVRSCNFTNHVEMDWVATKLESLADIEELNVFHTSRGCLITWRVKHDSGTILVYCCVLFISLEFDISCKKTNFSSQLNEIFIIITIVIYISVVLVQEWFSKRYSCSTDCSDDSNF